MSLRREVEVMEEVPPSSQYEHDAEDALVEQLRVFLFDKNMRPRKGRKEFLTAIVGDLAIPQEDALAAVSNEVRQILKPLYGIDPKYSASKKKDKDGKVVIVESENKNRRLDYLLTLIRRVTIGMHNVPKGPFHQHLLPHLSMPALETYAKASAHARREVDKYYRIVISQHQLSDLQKRILTAIRHKDIKKLKAALTNPNFTITDLDAIGIFDPLVYAHLNDFQQGLNAIYSICSIKRSLLPNPIDLLTLQIRTHQNKNRWINTIDYYEFATTVRHYNLNKAQLLQVACDANNREMVNFLCATFGFMENAIQAGDLAEVKRLLENGANPTDYPIEHWYANAGQLKLYNYIHFAIAEGKTDIAKYLIDQTSVEDICNDANVFAKAAEANSLEILQYLFKKIGKNNAYFFPASNSTNLSPLQHACRNGNLEMATLLVKKLKEEALNVGSWDAYIERRHGVVPSYTGRTALYFACNQENHETANTFAALLLQKGADVNSESIWGETPLLAAYCNGNVGLATTLIEKGANPLRLLGPVKYKFSLRGVAEDDINHVERINNGVSANAREDLVIQILERYIQDHPTREIAQRLLNSVQGREPSLTGGDKFRLAFAPTLGKIYKIATPFLKSFVMDSEVEPLLAPNSPRKIAQGTAGASPPVRAHSNNDQDELAAFPRSRSSSQTEFGLGGKGKEEEAEQPPPTPPSTSLKATKE